MTKIVLTKENVEKFALLGQKPTVTVSRRLISFNLAAAKKLALHKGDFFQLEIDEGKLYYKTCVDKTGFQVNNVTKYGSLNAGGKGVLGSLYHNRVVDEIKSTRFVVEPFKDGRHRLTKVKGRINKK